MTVFDPLLGNLINTIPLCEDDPFIEKGKLYILEEGIVFEEDGATKVVFFRYVNDIIFLEKAMYEKYLCQLIYRDYLGNEKVRNLYINVNDYNYIRSKVKL